jgi:CRP/FNR family cyclic AMP-dependent transcriptional regulator
METLEGILLEHPLFAGLPAPFATLIVDCAHEVRFKEGEFLFREGAPANDFFLVREGRVALEMHAPGRQPLRLMTVQSGQLAGLSWLVPPYRWAFDAVALEPVRAIAVNAMCLRGKLEEDHELGYELMKRFVPVLLERMQAARLQMMDVYGKPGR